jgi:hypothetical protein
MRSFGDPDSEGANVNPPLQAVRAGDDDEIQRLRRAETDLERAIGECRSALAEVRRELREQDAVIPPAVH